MAENKRPCCPECGSETSIYPTEIDVRWNPETQAWELLSIGDELECTDCDYGARGTDTECEFGASDAGFPDPEEAFQLGADEAAALEAAIEAAEEDLDHWERNGSEDEAESRQARREQLSSARAALNRLKGA